MLSIKPCTIVLRSGQRIECQRILTVGTTIVGTSSGDIKAATSDGEVTISLDDVANVTQ